MRRSLVLEAGGYDEAIRYATDWDLWLRLILGGARAGCLMEPLATYRLQRGSLSSQLASMLAGRVTILEKAARRGDLSGEERAVLERALRDYRAAARRRAGARGAARGSGGRARALPAGRRHARAGRAHPGQAAGGRGGAAGGRRAAARAASRDDRRSAARSQ